MSNFLFYAAAFALALGCLIVVHEFGHYTVARLCGVKVLRFSLGFGRQIFARRFHPNGTEWALALIPLGGYVKMLDEREAPVAPQELAFAFNRQPLARRMAIVAAGPLANFLLAVLIYWGIFWHGSEELRPVISAPPAASAAAAAGFTHGERIASIAGETVTTWEDVHWRLLAGAVDRDSVTVETQNEQGEIALHRLDLGPIRAAGWEGDVFALLGLQPYRPRLPAVIGQVQPGLAGAAAGLESGDVIVAIDDVAIAYWPEFVRAVRAAPGQTLRARVRRAGDEIELLLTPEARAERGQRFGHLGVSLGGEHHLRSDLTVRVAYSPVAALQRALRETWEKSAFTVTMLGRMVIGEVSWRNVSGPVSIADYAGQSARLGAEHYLKFMALISISLGVLNLLPIPILDGGHLMYYFAELLKGSPVSERSMEIGQQIGMALLFSLMAFALYNDFSRIFSG